MGVNMIDGWENKTNYTVNDLENCTIIDRGDYSFQELNELLNLDRSIRLPTSAELDILHDWERLCDSPDSYWDNGFFKTIARDYDEEDNDLCLQLILLKEGEK